MRNSFNLIFIFDIFDSTKKEKKGGRGYLIDRDFLNSSFFNYVKN